MLNKITGCKPRTVPPLYVPMVRSLTKVSHWKTPGRLSAALRSQSSKHESEDLRNGLFPLLCVIRRSAFVAEKRLRHHLWCRSLIVFRRNDL